MVDTNKAADAVTDAEVDTTTDDYDYDDYDDYDDVVTLPTDDIQIPTPSHATVSITIDNNDGDNGDSDDSGDHGDSGNSSDSGDSGDYGDSGSNGNNYKTLEITALDTVIDDTMTTAGVWGLYDENGVLLDVAQTVNITAEWKALQGKLSRPKFISMQDNGVDLTKLVGKVIAFENDLKRRLMIEMAFAIEYNARYWHPQPYTFQCPGIDDPNAIGIDYTPVVYSFSCEVCGKEYETLRGDVNVKVCPGCKEELPGEGRNVLRCKDCGLPFKTNGSVTNYCPSCDEKRRTFKCEICNSSYKYTDSDLNRYAKSFINVCPECRTTIPGSGDYLLKCKSCNSLFKGASSNIYYCSSCNEEARTFNL